VCLIALLVCCVLHDWCARLLCKDMSICEP